MPRRAWFVAFAGLVSFSAPAVAELEEESRELCQLGRVRLTLERERERNCGRFCTTSETHWALDAAGSTWFRITTWSSDEEEEWAPDSEPIEISCASRQMRLVQGEARIQLSARSPDLLTLETRVGAQVDGAWHAPPALEEEEFARRRSLAELLRRLLSTAEERQRMIEGLDENLLCALSLLIARDQIARGEWESAGQTLNAVPCSCRDDDELGARHARLHTELATLRADAGVVAERSAASTAGPTAVRNGTGVTLS